MTGIGFVKPPAEEERWVAATSEADWAAQGTAEEQAASGVLCVGNLSQGSGFSSQGVRHAGLRLVENQGEAEQSTDADFRARGILPAVFTTSGGTTRGSAGSSTTVGLVLLRGGALAHAPLRQQGAQ